MAAFVCALLLFVLLQSSRPVLPLPLLSSLPLSPLPPTTVPMSATRSSPRESNSESGPSPPFVSGSQLRLRSSSHTFSGVPWRLPQTSSPLLAAASASSATPSHSIGEHAEITLPNGNTYRGELSSTGKPHGQGRLQFTTGSVYQGSVKKGTMDGVGMISWPSGKHYEGEFVSGKRHGLGVQWDAEGKLTRSGRRTAGEFTKPCAVPLRYIPQGNSLSSAGQPHAAHHGLRCVVHRCCAVADADSALSISVGGCM